jgi:hypothetical protein
VIILALALVLTPQQAAIRALADQDLRVATVGYSLARAAGPAFCSGQYLSTNGLVIQDAAQYTGSTRDDARKALGLGSGPTVVGIVPGGPASVQVGDVIVAVNGTTISAQPQPDPYSRVAQVEDGIEASAAGRATLDIVRHGVPLQAPMAMISGCRTRFQIVRGGLGATQADGRYVQISERMIGLTPADDALAAVLAHELSHNILRHNALKTRSKQAENEADRLSIWVIARAGYDLDAVLRFWGELRRRTDYGIFADGTHPAWRDRIARLTAAVGTVKAQQAAGQDLVPPAQ